MSILIEPIDDKESSNEMTEPSHLLFPPNSRCKIDSDCPKDETCSIIRILKSRPPQPVYGCMKPNGKPESPKEGI